MIRLVTRSLILGVALATVAACRVGGVQPIPFRGPAPVRVLVWPGLPEDVAASRLLDDLAFALRRRGYDVVAPAVARQLLIDAEMPAEGPFAAAGVDLAGFGARTVVDAVLHVVVRQWAIEGAPLQRARWDLGWELVSTRGEGVLWRFDHKGVWLRPRDEVDPHRRLDADPEIVSFGGEPAPGFRDAKDLAFWLHRHAMEHMPARSR